MGGPIKGTSPRDFFQATQTMHLYGATVRTISRINEALLVFQVLLRL